MRLIGLEAVLGLMMLAFLLLLIAALVDLARRPAREWEMSGHNQLVWALIVVFIGILGPILYLAIARPALQDAERKVQSVSNGV